MPKLDFAAVAVSRGSRNLEDLTTYSDIDMKCASSDDRYVHKDGTPYPKPQEPA